MLKVLLTAEFSIYEFIVESLKDSVILVLLKKDKAHLNDFNFFLSD